MKSTQPIRVLIVDDSALVRDILADVLNADSGIEVIGTAGDAHIAREKIKALNPDVLTLDVEMPRMDGLTFLSNLMRLRPMPVVMVSSLTERGAEVTLDALAMGAVDYLAKPRLDIAATLGSYGEELIGKIKAAAKANVRAIDSRRMRSLRTRNEDTSPALKIPLLPRRMRTTERIIAIGASTGGTEAIKEILCHLPPDCPGVVIAQHIPAAFSASFAKRMNDLSPLTVCEAQNNQQILPGHAYIAPGDFHLRLKRDGARYVCNVTQDANINRHRPSVDALFRSVAQNAGENAIGIILTGMGRDGARGLKEMRQAGAETLAQDEHTSVVWGMPGEAVSIGATQQVLPVELIAKRIMELITAMDSEHTSAAG
jgi:two-component system, chemotaxis family, protein-glutamate methylesterase/glutaminase